ncbi:MAG: M28 family peptidase [Treponema sp.]|jgi:hypothetical protein|nr:M28 family peptidase [Treponema sp.]
MDMLPALFSAFIAPDCDRRQFIIDFLAAQGIKTSVIHLAASRHIFVHFPASAYSPLFRLKTVVVHYDRAEGSPGANDNSAAIFQVMDWAVRLRNFPGVHNVRIFFTDGEELGSSGSVKAQGAFGLASGFKALGIINDDVYAFDSCGRGTVLVLSSAGVKNSGSAVFKSRFDGLYRRTGELLRAASPENWLTLPVPYSDNAGFLACGIPAVAITVLPSGEATQYLRELREDKVLETAALKNAGASPEIKSRLPETWRLIHSPADCQESLSPESFPLMARLLDLLAKTKVMV